MSGDIAEQPAAAVGGLVDAAELVPVVRRALSTEMAELVTWEHRVLYGGAGMLAGKNSVHRFGGSARVGDRTLPWSAVLKLVGAPSGSTTGVGDPTHADYWRRELLAFESGLLDELPSGMAAPRCFGVDERPEGVRIWMEEVSDTVGPQWPLRRFAIAARHLGRFNGAYLAGRPLPPHTWLGRGILRARADRNTPFWTNLDDVRGSALLQRGWPGDLADRGLRLFQERHALLDSLDRLPQTLRHGDAGRNNLLARNRPAGGEQTVAIDWAFLGIGPVGEEVATLVLSSVLWSKGAEPYDLQELDATAFDGYLAGLHDAGWHGDPRLVRLGCTATMALRYGPLLGIVSAVTASTDERAAMERTIGQPLEDMLDRYAVILRFALERADEARALAGLV